MLFLESTTAPTDLPIDILQTQDDAGTASNFTRSDANCDKTGTCYDGKIILMEKLDEKISTVALPC